jgi:hypothetical protein
MTTKRALQVGAVVVGVLSALVVLAVVARLAPRYLDDQPYAGALLLIPAPLLLIVAVDLWSPLRRAGMWVVGAAACAGIALVYVVGLAFGLPDGSDTSWWDTWVVGGLVAGAVYLGAMTGWFWAERTMRASTRTTRVHSRPHPWSRPHVT